MQGSIAFDGTLSGSIAGGGGGGSEVTITPTLTSGTKIADYEIDSTPGELYAPTPESLTAAAPLDITSGVISIDLSNYATTLDLNSYQEKLTAGSNITIDAQNEISATVPTVSAVQIQTTGTHIADITVNSTTTEIYAPSGGSSWDYSTSEVDTGQLWIDGVSHIYSLVVPYNTQLVSNSWEKIVSITNETVSPIDVCAINTNNYDYKYLESDFDLNDGLYVCNRTAVAYTPTHIIFKYIKLS